MHYTRVRSPKQGALINPLIQAGSYDRQVEVAGDFGSGRGGVPPVFGPLSGAGMGGSTN